MTKKKFKKIKQKAPIMNHIKFNEVSDVKYADFIDICRMTQDELKGFLLEALQLAKYKPLNGDGWVYAKGEIPILLTAHMDTVHKVQMYQMLHYRDLLIKGGFVALKISTIFVHTKPTCSEWMDLEKNQLKTCWAV